MAQKKITDLSLRSDFDATCNVPVDDSSQTWRVTGQQIQNYIKNLTVVNKTTTYTATSLDDLILCSGSAFTITLPLASSCPGKVLQFKKTDNSVSNIITIDIDGSDVIRESSNTVSSTTLNTDGELVQIVSNGSSTWDMIRRDYPRNWNAFTMGITGTGSNPTKGTVTEQASWRRVGDSMEIQYSLIQTVAGTAGTGDYLFALPFGAMDASKITTSSGTYSSSVVGYCSVTANSNASNATGNVNAYDSTHLAMSGGTIGANHVGLGNYDLSNGTTKWEFFARVPILGWN